MTHSDKLCSRAHPHEPTDYCDGWVDHLPDDAKRHHGIARKEDVGDVFVDRAGRLAVLISYCDSPTATFEYPDTGEQRGGAVGSPILSGFRRVSPQPDTARLRAANGPSPVTLEVPLPEGNAELALLQALEFVVSWFRQPKLDQDSIIRATEWLAERERQNSD